MKYTAVNAIQYPMFRRVATPLADLTVPLAAPPTAGDRSVPFWELVVLCCSADARIEATFRRCVAALGLPAATEFRVLPDPPGPKVEGGGATLHALQTLREELGDRLDELRVLLIQAGQTWT